MKTPRPVRKSLTPATVYLPDRPVGYALDPTRLDGMERRLRLSNPPCCPSCGGHCYGLKAELPRPAFFQPSRGLKGTVVYVVRLLPFATLLPALQRKVRKDNPRCQESLPLLYVGQTRLEAIQRLHNHWVGYKSSPWVRRFGCELIDASTEAAAAGCWPEPLRRQVAALAARSEADGKQREADVTALLRAHGYPVMSH